MKSYKSLIYTGLFLCCWVVVLSVIHRKGDIPGRFIYGEIPEQTKRHFNTMAKAVDVSIRFNPDIRPQDWQDRFNYGENPKIGLEKVEDDNFIVYFNDSEEWADHANTTLQIVHEAIPELIVLMDWYFFPADINDRKLSIYLAKDKNQYIRFTNSIARTKLKDINDTSAGIYISQYSRMGNLTLGIVLDSSVWDSTANAKQIIRHNLNHYVYFTSLEYDKIIAPQAWVYEGLAEYFSLGKNDIQQDEAMQYLGYSLSGDFPDYKANCKGGGSVYHYIEMNYGKGEVIRFVKSTYNKTVEQAANEVFNISTQDLEKQWKHYLAGLATRKTD
jgi:hypothetical protein